MNWRSCGSWPQLQSHRGAPTNSFMVAYCIWPQVAISRRYNVHKYIHSRSCSTSLLKCRKPLMRNTSRKNAKWTIKKYTLGQNRRLNASHEILFCLKFNILLIWSTTMLRLSSRHYWMRQHVIQKMFFFFQKTSSQIN